MVLGGRNWELQLKATKDSLVFIDEGNAFVASKDFAAAIRQTDNYYIIVNRESLETLPYSVTEIYGIRNSGKYGNLKQTYNELYRIYGEDDFSQSIKPEKLLVEDSNAGFQFYEVVCREKELACISAGGKSNIFRMLTEQKDEKVLVIADGAAFGSEMERIMKVLADKKNIRLYLPESFEWLILKSGLLKDNGVNEILSNPSEYIESKEYFSWERFFTAVLVQKTEQSYLKYSKNKLNPVYTQKSVVNMLLDGMEKIELGLT